MILRIMFGSRCLIKPLCLHTLRQLRTFQTIPSNSDKVIETIIHVSKIVPGNYTKPASHPLVSYPILHIKETKSIKFSGVLDIFEVKESLLKKLSVFGVTNDVYIDQLLKLGSQIIRLVPMLYRLLNNPLLDRLFDKHIMNGIENHRIPENSARTFDSYLIKSQSIQMLIALNFIQDPKRCLNNLLASIESDNLYVSDISGLIGDVLDKNYFEPIVTLDPDYMFYKGNQFTLPPLSDESILVPNLLVNSSISKFIPKVKDHTPFLDLSSTVGNSIYKAMIRAALLDCSQAEHSSIFSVLTDENYLEFLLENIGIFDRLMKSEVIEEQLLARNSRDVYYRQFGQYITILFMNQFDNLHQWCLQLTSNYFDIYESLNPMEIRQFEKDFSIMLQKQSTWIDKQKLERMKSILKLVTTKKHDDHNHRFQNIAKDYINFCSYKEGLRDSFSIANKHQMLVLEATNERELLIDFGAFLVRDNKKATEYVNKIVRKLLNKPANDIRLKSITQFLPHFNNNRECSFLKDNEQTKLFDLACINYHISKDYLRQQKLLNNDRERAIELLKHLAQIGYPFYRYCIYLWTSKHNLTDEESQLVHSILQLKIFKTYIYERMSIFEHDTYYHKLIKHRVNNKYLQLKFGQTGFDQIIGVIALTHPEQIYNWIGKLIESLQHPKQQQETIPDILNLQPPAICKFFKVTSSLKSLDSKLQQYYNKMTS